MRVPAFLALLCWVACASAWECDENAEHLTAVDIKIKSHEDHVIYGQLHACPRAGEELSQNLRFRFQNPRNIILDQETGRFQYSPDREHFSGVDNFVYTVEDEVERSEPASVFISLRPQPDEPRLQVQHVQGNEGEVIPLHIQAELEDQDGSETLTVTLCNCGQEVSCKSDKCRCQLSVPSGWHFLAGGQRVHRRNLNKLTQDQANQLSVHVPENSHGQYCFGVHAITVEQKGKGHVHAQVSQDMHITVHSRNQPPTITHHSKTETLRWCTISSQEQQKCQEMSRAFSRRLNHRLECVQGQSSEDCMYKISNNMADVITLDGGDIYTAGSKYNLVPVMGEDYGNGDASYWAVAVVRKDNPEINMNNLRGRKSCHTGIGKTSGWNVPVGWLIQNNQIQVDNRRSIPQTVGSFFSKSCVPGAQSPEYNPDGTNPESLCSLCVGEGENRCVRNTNEPYYGYSGAFRCLVEGAGEVAFVNHVTVYENTNSHSEEEWTRNLDEDDFELLCPDGSRRPWHQYKECNLARVPAHAVMTSYHSQRNLQQIVEVLNQAQQHFGVEGSDDFEMFDSSEFGGRDLLFRDNVQRLVPVGQRNTWQKWLGSSYMESVGHLISHDQERNQRVLNKQIRWCATSEAEMDKCEQMSKTLTERGFVPTIKCVQANNADQCMQMIHMNQADVITLDGGDIYQAGMKYNMRPIMGEDYGNGDASYWAVAVVRKDDPEINMNNLRGRKSCHTGLGKTAGWIIPTGWLVDQDFVQTDGQTSLVQAVGHFFSKSCVPGAKSPEYDPQNTNPSTLCSLCAGAGEDHCVRNKNEPYYGYSGAFRCLAEGAGDVAFINHQTVQDNTDGHNPENWAAGLHADDFELLCTDGSRRPVDQWRECSLARVPSHAVMTSNDRSQEWVNRVVRLLKGVQEMFGSDENENDFQLFDSSSFGGHDLLFRDDTQHLVEVGSKDSWEKWLGQEYLRCIRSHHSDTHSSSGQQPALSTSEGRPVLLSNLRIQDAEGHNGRYHVHATVNQGGHLWVRDGLDSIVFTSDAKSKTTNQHDTRHHRHQDSHQRSEESELSREDSSSQEHPRRHPRSHESRSHESHSQERNHQDSNPLSHLWDGLWKMWDSSDERQHSSEERQHSSEESHRDMAWHDVHTSVEKERQELTVDDDFYQHYKHHHFQYSKNGRPSLSFSGDLAAVQKALSSLVFVPWCQQWPTPPNWDLPPTTWMFPSEEDQTRSEDPNHPAIWPAWYPRFWYPFPTKSWTWWPRVLPPYWLNKQCQDWTSMIHISVSEEAPSSCASRQDRRDRPVTDMDIPVHVQSRTSGPISLIPKNLFYYFDSEAESVPINDIHIRSQLTDVNLHLKFNVIEDHLATVQAESVEAPEFTCTSVEECNEHLRTVKVHFRNGVRATDFCHLGIQISMFKDNSDVPSDLLTVWAYQTSGRCVDPWATNSNFHLSNERSQTNQRQTVNINLIPEDLSNEESLNGILHVTIHAPHGLVTFTAPDGLRTFVDHMGVRQRIPTNLCLSGPAEMVKQALQTVRYTPIRAFTGTDSITIEYGTTRTAMRLSPDKIHPRMTVVHKVEVRPVPSPILVQAPSHMCVNQQQRPLPHIDSNLELQSMWHKPAPNMVKLTVTATSGDVNINQHKLQQEFHPSESSQEHHQDMVHLHIEVEHRQRPSGSWLQVTAEDWVVRHILHNQLVWYRPNKCVSSQQPTQHDTIHVEVEEVKSEHVTSSEIQVTVDCHQPQQQRWQVDGVSSSEQQSREVSSEWSLELSPWSVEQTSTQVEVTSDSECTPTEPWNDWSECDADSCQMGTQWRERRTRNTNPASNRYCQPQRETRQCTNCGCKPVRQYVKHPAPSFQDCQTVRQVLRCPETCRPTKTSFAEEQFDCRGRTLNKDVLIHEACACVECAVKHTKESWHSSERQPSSNERWSDELDFPWF